MVYFLIVLSLALAGIAGILFFYLTAMEKIGREQKRRVAELERHCAHLSARLQDAETRIAHQAEFIEAFEYYQEEKEEDDVWADVIE
jgi:hypothetical protein